MSNRVHLVQCGIKRRRFATEWSRHPSQFQCQQSVMIQGATKSLQLPNNRQPILFQQLATVIKPSHSLNLFFQSENSQKCVLNNGTRTFVFFSVIVVLASRSNSYGSAGDRMLAMKATPNYNTHFSALSMAPKARFTEQQTLLPAYNYGSGQQKTVQTYPTNGYSSPLPKIIRDQPQQYGQQQKLSVRSEPVPLSPYGSAINTRTNEQPQSYGQPTITRNLPSYSSPYSSPVTVRTNPQPVQYGQTYGQQPEGKALTREIMKS